MAISWGWIGHHEVGNELSSIYFLTIPFTLGFAAWALARSTRTLRDFGAAGARERILAVVACVLSAPALTVSAMGLLAMGLLAVGSGGG